MKDDTFKNHVVAALLETPEMEGRDLRLVLPKNRLGFRMSGVRFYQRMIKLVEAGVVEYWDIIDSELLRSRCFRLKSVKQ